MFRACQHINIMYFTIKTVWLVSNTWILNGWKCHMKAPSAHIMEHCKCAVDSYVEYTVKWGDLTVE